MQSVNDVVIFYFVSEKSFAWSVISLFSSLSLVFGVMLAPLSNFISNLFGVKLNCRVCRRIRYNTGLIRISIQHQVTTAHFGDRLGETAYYWNIATIWRLTRMRPMHIWEYAQIKIYRLRASTGCTARMSTQAGRGVAIVECAWGASRMRAIHVKGIKF